MNKYSFTSDKDIVAKLIGKTIKEVIVKTYEYPAVLQLEFTNGETIAISINNDVDLCYWEIKE